MSRLGWLVVVAALATPVVHAQGSGSTSGSGSSFAVSRNVKGTIHDIDHEKKVVVIMAEGQMLYQFTLDDPKLKLKAEKKTALAASKKKIELKDFVKGQAVRITYPTDAPSRARELRLLKDGAAGSVSAGRAAQ